MVLAQREKHGSCGAGILIRDGKCCLHFGPGVECLAQHLTWFLIFPNGCSHVTWKKKKKEKNSE